MSQGVLKEIPHHPLDELDIGHGENALDIEERVQVDAALLRSDSKAQCHVLQKLRHDKGLKLRCDGAGFQLGELEQSVDQPPELIRLPQGDAQVRTQVALRKRDVLHERGLDVTAQAGKRRAQIVRDVRNQLAPQLIRCLEVADLMLNRL